MKKLSTTQGNEILLDDDDFEWAKEYSWSEANGYARRYIPVNKSILMHREIMNAKKDQWVDHKNRKKLDNRKENLRFCTPSQNQYNRKGYGFSKYKGVSWDKSRNKWSVAICVKGKSQHIGYYESERDAALTYNDHAVRKHGEFAKLNEIS